MVDYGERLKRAVIATDRAARALQASLREIEPVRPVSPADLNPDGGSTASICESFVMRFSRLQDIMGAQLFPNAVACLEMEDAPGSRDALDRLEAWGLLTVSRWYTVRGLRNNFTHVYDEDERRLADSINDSLLETPYLLEVQGAISAYVKDRFPRLFTA